MVDRSPQAERLRAIARRKTGYYSGGVEALRAVAAAAWDEGAQWAAVELGAIDNERQAWITPSDNPYLQTEEENSNG